MYFFYFVYTMKYILAPVGKVGVRGASRPSFERPFFVSRQRDFGFESLPLKFGLDEGGLHEKEDDAEGLRLAVDFPEIRHGAGAVSTAGHRRVAWQPMSKDSVRLFSTTAIN